MPEVADDNGVPPPAPTGDELLKVLSALGNPHRVRTLTLVEPPAFWVLPNHGHDDSGARSMQQFVSSLRGATISEDHVERFRCLLGDCAGGRCRRGRGPGR